MLVPLVKIMSLYKFEKIFKTDTKDELNITSYMSLSFVSEYINFIKTLIVMEFNALSIIKR